LLELSNKHKLKFQRGSCNEIKGKAVFSKNNNIPKRYFLEKRWSQGNDIFTAIMMNPSKASHNNSDDTVDQLIEVAKNHSCNALYVVNVSSFIESSSNKLNSEKFVFDRVNWFFIEQAILESKLIFIGWGMKGQNGIIQQQKNSSTILKTFKEAKDRLYTYEFLKSKNKKYKKKPFFYVPHPRPIRSKEKYRYQRIKKLSYFQFKKIFVR
jgi:Uncharacterized protein conserved in bacteria